LVKAKNPIVYESGERTYDKFVEYCVKQLKIKSRLKALKMATKIFDCDNLHIILYMNIFNQFFLMFLTILLIWRFLIFFFKT